MLHAEAPKIRNVVGDGMLRFPPGAATGLAAWERQHGRFDFGFGRRSWAVRFLLTNDDCDNAFAVSALMLFEAQRRS